MLHQVWHFKHMKMLISDMHIWLFSSYMYHYFIKWNIHILRTNPPWKLWTVEHHHTLAITFASFNRECEPCNKSREEWQTFSPKGWMYHRNWNMWSLAAKRFLHVVQSEKPTTCRLTMNRYKSSLDRLTSEVTLHD